MTAPPNALPCLAALALVLSTGVSRAEPAEVQPCRIITEFNAALAERDIPLIIVRLPLRDDLYEGPETPHTQPYDSPRARTRVGNRAEKILEAAGIPVIGTHERILAASVEREIFEEDRFHYQLDSFLDPLAVELFDALQDRGRIAPEDNVLIIGDCCASYFVDAIRYEHPDRHGSLRSFFKLAGGWQIHRQLMLFEEDELADTDMVIWVFTDRHFANASFAELPVGEPPELQPRTANATVVSAPLLSPEEAAKLEYPACLGAGVFADENGEHFIAHYPLVANRRPLPSAEKFTPNRPLTLRLAPLVDYQRTHPEAQRAKIIDPQATDYDTPRYYVLGWVNR